MIVGRSRVAFRVFTMALCAGEMDQPLKSRLTTKTAMALWMISYHLGFLPQEMKFPNKAKRASRVENLRKLKVKNAWDGFLIYLSYRLFFCRWNCKIVLRSVLFRIKNEYWVLIWKKFKVANFLALCKQRECILVFLFEIAFRKRIFSVGNLGFIKRATQWRDVRAQTALSSPAGVVTWVFDLSHSDWHELGSQKYFALHLPND